MTTSAIVTGAAGGVGSSVVERLLADPDRAVVAVDRSEAVRELSSRDPRVIAVVGDVTDPTTAQAAVDSINHYVTGYGPGPSASREITAKVVDDLTVELDSTVPDWALAFRWDIVLRGREATPLDNDDHH